MSSLSSKSSSNSLDSSSSNVIEDSEKLDSNNESRAQPNYSVPDSEERERELEEFRRQWTAEVVARQRQQQHKGDTNNLINKIPVEQTTKDTIDVLNHLSLKDNNDTNSSSSQPELTSSQLNDGAIASSQVPFKPIPLSALEHYRRATQFESKSQLGDALTHYQQAFRMNPNVDRDFHRIYQGNDSQSLPTTKTSSEVAQKVEGEDVFVRTIQLEDDYKPHRRRRGGNAGKDAYRSTLEKDPFQQLLRETRKVTNELFDPLVALFRLPKEILLRIVQCLGLLEVRALMRFSQVARLPLVLVYDPSVWRLLCERNYMETGSEIELRQLSLTASKAKLQQELEEDYYNDWHLMYIDRPRVRVDGVYISTCFYIREGLSENTYYQPVHLVTYYRYLRFFRDGSCIARLTSDEPAQVVRGLRLDTTKAMDMAFGHWTLNEDSLRIEVASRQRPTIIFHMQLGLRSSSRGRHNKLNWSKYISIDTTRDNEINEYSLNQFKSYYFSRVLAFPS
ncbi:hypothetical protein BDF19DRAFT_443268 [Syncephalis fuscata]|nr:hypothetical protein BDF19DRAFT_443268 [Syncephalis fuscata]